MIEILDGMVRKLEPVTNKIIGQFPVEFLTPNQFAAFERARKACQEASIAQGF